jgi:hypothetical protein
VAVASRRVLQCGDDGVLRPFIVLSLSMPWPWKRIAVVAAAIGLAADILLDFIVARRL